MLLVMVQAIHNTAGGFHGASGLSGVELQSPVLEVVSAVMGLRRLRRERRLAAAAGRGACSVGIAIVAGSLPAIVRVVESRTGTIRAASYLSIFAAPFDALVGIAVQSGEVLPKLFVGAADGVAVAHRSELLRESPQRSDVEFVLVGLHGRMLGLDMLGKADGSRVPTLRLPSCVNCFPQSSSLQTKGFMFSCTIL
jgi:hypothetical protein